MRKGFHQFDPVKMSRKEFDGLEFRDEVKTPAADTYYRDRAYPDEVFRFVPSPKGAGENRPDPKHPGDPAKATFHPHPKGHGEWQMGHADVPAKE